MIRAQRVIRAVKILCVYHDGYASLFICATPQSEPLCKLWSSGADSVSASVHLCKKCTTLGQDADDKGDCACVGGQGI